MSEVRFSFGGDPPPSFEILAAEVPFEFFGIGFGLILLPFALGYLARLSLVWSLVALFAVKAHLCLQYSMQLQIGGLAPARMPFPWEYFIGWIAISLPGMMAGYLANHLYLRRRLTKDD